MPKGCLVADPSQPPQPSADLHSRPPKSYPMHRAPATSRPLSIAHTTMGHPLGHPQAADTPAHATHLKAVHHSAARARDH
ncbi:hypothetical protein PCANC_05758 [Puccinia coronata f. sp. avenae]|uniref:Uncharacterized protein n=1 Tax=Puccinia coronata f. sp. avenae TaxID=200324 RepID=A0A2N5VSF6_9BASI|nr:hypothetical protein PCANC_05758 [Puccinia coronata f. sp. avenae]